ncbi:60S acidic ribosomal protein P1 [Perkinsus olseni]|uniref:60S acidic ribosomal protein P1 n=1 Tax=Perkinsus olseni TaxID=32597 RepID=A0A7J6P7N9_PEROL|nr:60S acidic ribosomal protein P1 [Perkinsus olseni]
MLNDALADLAAKLHSDIEMRITEMVDELEKREAREETQSKEPGKENDADLVGYTPSTRDGTSCDFNLGEQQAEERTSAKRKRAADNSSVVPGPTPDRRGSAAAVPDKKEVTVSELIEDSPPENWSLTARVASVSALRKWEKGNRSGHVCTLEIIDKDNQPIRAVLFNQIKAEMLFEFSGGKVQPAHPKWNAVSTHELAFSSPRARLIPLSGDDGGFARPSRLTFIKNIADLPPRTIVDVCGICITCTDVEEVKLTDGRTKPKRSFELVDQSGEIAHVTGWDDMALQSKIVPEVADLQRIVAMKGARVDIHTERSLCIDPNTVVEVEPKTSPVARLLEWKKRQETVVDLE